MNEPEKPKLPLLAKEYDTYARSYFVIEDGNGCELSDEGFFWIREAANNHDRLTEENAKLRDILEMVIFEAERNFDNSIDIDGLKEQLNQLKGQSK